MELGEVRQLGRHRLLCGDAFNPDHVDRLLDGAKPDMLYCDPPYGMGLSPSTHGYVRSQPAKNKAFNAAKGIANRHDIRVVVGDDAPFDPHPLVERFSHTREQFWWGADYYRAVLPSGGSWVVWDKRTQESTDRMFGSCFELCWSRTSHRREVARIKWAGVFGTEREPGRKRVHPTQKPVLLAEWFLEKYSKPDAVILDLFGGAGGTLLACERLNRTCCMAEISPDYCEVIIQRYEQMTQQPRLMEAV